jgi:hypothetical protein
VQSKWRFACTPGYAFMKWYFGTKANLTLYFLSFLAPIIYRSLDNAVRIATGYGLDDKRGRSSSPGRVKNFLFSTSSRPALGSTQPPIQWVPGVKRQRREADNSPLASAEVKKMWIYTSTPHTPSWRA